MIKVVIIIGLLFVMDAWLIVTVIRKEREQNMSVDKYAYEPWKCDGRFCPGDCRFCDIADMTRDEDEDAEEEIGEYL